MSVCEELESEKESDIKTDWSQSSLFFVTYVGLTNLIFLSLFIFLFKDNPKP